MCQKRRELACVSGKWLQGPEDEENESAVVGNDLKRKLSDVSHVSESDWVRKKDVYEMCLDLPEYVGECVQLFLPAGIYWRS